MSCIICHIVCGKNLVIIYDGYTEVSLASGHVIAALHAEQPGQRETAEAIGTSVRHMNREHDLLHVLIAHAVGLDESPALLRAAKFEPPADVDALEEEAVLSVQKWLAALGHHVVPFTEPEPC